MEGLEGFSTVASLPYSTLLGPLQSVDGRLLAGWLDQQPLLLLLVKTSTQKHCIRVKLLPQADMKIDPNYFPGSDSPSQWFLPG